MLHESSVALRLVDDLVADGKAHFTFAEAVRHVDRSSAATANLLRRMVGAGLVDRVRRGRYVIRPFGVLGTRAAAEDVALAVAAAFSSLPHRIGYRSALDEHDLISHPSRIIYVACTKRVRAKQLSGRPLRAVVERAFAVGVGAFERAGAKLSDLERAILDAAARPELVGGAAVLAEALSTAGSGIDPERLARYASQLRWGPALRRIGSIADALGLGELAGRLSPLSEPRSDLDLEPGTHTSSVWRDARWRVRWSLSRDELANVVWQ